MQSSNEEISMRIHSTMRVLECRVQYTFIRNPMRSTLRLASMRCYCRRFRFADFSESEKDGILLSLTPLLYLIAPIGINL